MRKENKIDTLENSLLEEGLSRRLREAREALGLSQEDVAQKLGMARTTVLAIEATKRRVTGLELKQFSELFKRDYYFLLDGEVRGGSIDNAILRTATSLTQSDKEKLLSFAEFLKTSTLPPDVPGKNDPSSGS